MVVSKKSKSKTRSKSKAKTKSKSSVRSKSKSPTKKVIKVDDDATIFDSALSSDQTIAQLKAVAKKMGVSLTGITKKADIIAALSGPSKTGGRKKSSPKKSPTPILEVSSKQTIKELRVIAKKLGVSLSGITKKADIIKALSSPKSSKAKSSSKNYVACRVYLRPYLEDGSMDGDDYGIKTGNAKVDKLVVDRLKKDYTHIKDIFSYDTKVLNYEFNGEFVVVDLAPMGTPKQTENKINEIFDLGPDTWMEGDLRILKGNEIKGTEFEGDVELLFKLIRFVHIYDQESEV